MLLVCGGTKAFPYSSGVARLAGSLNRVDLPRLGGISLCTLKHLVDLSR